MQLHQPNFIEQLVTLKARLLVISFAPPEHFRKWREYWKQIHLAPEIAEKRTPEVNQLLQQTVFLNDPLLKVYRAYGLGKYSMLTVYGPSVLAKYTLYAAQGKKILKTREDVLQKGGDFAVSAEGKITFAYSGRNQLDRPHPQILLDSLLRT
ncbi:hypothetical protein [Candidatus Chlorohelix sp.]|uniref:hypothetical protein n=1 Tax=Candidatus Chlorohelix sp. TaxID=3139201 RepID=UPI00302152FA